MGLSMQETQKLRDAWGDKPCTHPQITKERGPMGQQTDYACVTCGEVAWSRAELEKQGKEVEKFLNQKG